MTLCDQIKLVDDLIKEDRDTTIRDYLEVLKDIAKVEEAVGFELRIKVLADSQFKRRE